ncbi:MAG: hypothetical protein AB1793_09375 [Candidatus Thermoplasmatota archaeon]
MELADDPRNGRECARAVTGSISRILVGALLVASAFGVALMVGGPLACFFLTQGEPLPTMDGPEDEDLRSEVRCTLVIAQSHTYAEGLILLRLPEGESTHVELEDPSISHSAIACDGSVAYLTRRSESLLLRVKDVESGREQTVLQRSGDFIDGSSVSLSPDGRYLTLLTSEDRGGFKRTPGQLELVDRRGTTMRIINDCQIGREVHWLADSVHYVFDSKDGVHIGSMNKAEDVHIPGAVEAITGESSTLVLVIGRDPIYAIDRNGRYRLYDVVKERYVDDIVLPGDLFGPIGFTDTGLVLYEALPTTGTEQKLLGWGLTYPSAQWTIKVCDPGSGRFATVVPHYGYGRIAFGSSI